MRIKCEKCGLVFNPRDDHKCPQIPEQYKISKKEKQEIEAAVATAQVLHRASQSIGIPVNVRLQPELMVRLDKARGGMTRPAKIREILEREL